MVRTKTSRPPNRSDRESLASIATTRIRTISHRPNHRLTHQSGPEREMEVVLATAMAMAMNKITATRRARMEAATPVAMTHPAAKIRAMHKVVKEVMIQGLEITVVVILGEAMMVALGLEEMVVVAALEEANNTTG